MRATAAAALAAGTAYLSLAATPFRGFRDFGIIGGMGMACCSISAYTVLPAALALAERRGSIPGSSGAGRHRLVRACAAKRPRPVSSRRRSSSSPPRSAPGATSPTSRSRPTCVTWPAPTRELDLGVALMDKFDRAFGHGISGGFALAVSRRDEVAPLVGKLRTADEGKPERQRLFSRVTTLDDRLPAD